MNKVLAAIITLGMLAGCASQQPKSAPQAAATPAQQGGGQKLAPPAPAAIDPLRDPNNMLSHRSIYYDFDSSAVKDEFKPLIEAHAKHLTTHPDARVTVQGNTDERGSREYNIALGNRRAVSVKKLMNALGVSDQQIEVVSFGMEKPKATCGDESCWKQNRRSDIVYEGEQ